LTVPPDQLPDLSLTHLILSDPVMLASLALPLVVVFGLVYFRLRAYRRLTDLAAKNEQRYDQTKQMTADQWREAAARTEQMIALLTEIRDQLARLAPPIPSLEGPENPDRSPS
jgi:hypothetical protein